MILTKTKVNTTQNDRLKILYILSDYKEHCGSEIASKVKTKDDRVRISELRKLGVRIRSETCNGFCGTVHKRGLYKRQLLYAPPELLKQALGMEEPQGTYKQPTQPASPVSVANFASQPYYQPKRKSQPYVWKPKIDCCDIAILCQEKNIPVAHSQGCVSKS